MRAIGSALLFLGTIVGFALAAAAADVLWIFLIVLVIAVGWGIRDKLRREASSLCRQRVNARRVPELESEVGTLSADLELLREHASKQWERGRDSGRKEIIGALMSERGELPELIGTEIASDTGALMLVGLADPPRNFYMGTRYALSSVSTGEVKGLLAVVFADETSGRVLLETVERTIEPYWQALEAQAILDSSKPPDVKIAAVSPTHLGQIEDQTSSNQGDIHGS